MKEKSQEATKYEPNWNSLDTRPLPDWYDFVKLGIFIHWGVFSGQFCNVQPLNKLGCVLLFLLFTSSHFTVIHQLLDN